MAECNFVTCDSKHTILTDLFNISGLEVNKMGHKKDKHKYAVHTLYFMQHSKRQCQAKTISNCKPVALTIVEL